MPSALLEDHLRVINVRFDGRAFVPDDLPDIPRDTPAKVIVADPPPPPDRPHARVGGEKPLDRLIRRAKEAGLEGLDVLPTDMATQHDHYLYGTPKDPENDFKPRTQGAQ